MESSELEQKIVQIGLNNGTSLSKLQIPENEPMYEIDLNTRSIKVDSSIINVETDHLAETIYFIVDRYFDNYDLSQSCCVVQYINANNESFLYPVPWFDIETYYDKDSPKIVFPWMVSRNAAEQSGTLKFSIRFFNVDSESDTIYYSLSTLPATMKIESSLNVNTSEEEENIRTAVKASDWEAFLQEVMSEQQGYIQNRINWVVLDD